MSEPIAETATEIRSGVESGTEVEGPEGETTLRAFGLAALASIASDGSAPEDQYLRTRSAAVMSGEESWTGRLGDYLRHPSELDAPLVYVASELHLTVAEVLAVALAAAVDDDLMVGRALAHLQAPVGGSRPTLGLLAAALTEVGGPRTIDVLANGVAVRSGLLTILGEEAPLAERLAGVPQHVFLALNGQDAPCEGTSLGLPTDAEIPFPPCIEHAAARHAAALLEAPQRALVVRAGTPIEAKAGAASVAAAMNRRPLFIETERVVGLGPWLLLRQFVPVFCFEPGPGERKTIPTIPLYSGPCLATCGPDGSIEGHGGAALQWSLPVPPPAEREMLWRQAVSDTAVASTLARQHRHGCGRIAQLGALARHQSALVNRDAVTMDDVISASRSGHGAGLDALAQSLLQPVPDEALVLPRSVRAEFEGLLQRCRVRDELTVGLGASAATRYSPGVRALLVGPSGTGKTLAAGWLATKLGLPLYRVDLAAVTSKYIGETEKNLAQLLARAEQAEVVLLFDEADSMFGKRTDVKDANDRFANAQTNYLLQRIETYDGITILTSNSRMRFDPAFARRLDVIIDLPPPAPDERRALWYSHLGSDHRVAGKDINKLAASSDFTGGQIRNVVLTAAVGAKVAGRPIEYGDVVHGLEGEYRKLGRQVPVELRHNAELRPPTPKATSRHATDHRQ